MAKYILFDTETTGAALEDRIIQIGGMIVSSKGEIEVYDELCSSDVEIKLEAMEVHNITPDKLIGKPECTQTQFYNKILELNSSENYLIAHNINFDMSMLEKEGFVNQYTIIDTLRCARHLLPDMLYHRLQYLRYALDLFMEEEDEAQKLGIVIKAHDAIGDVLVMKLLLSQLVQLARAKFPQEKNPMKTLANLTQTPVMVRTFKFGKYKGRAIDEVASEDAGYLNWMLEKTELDEDMKYTLQTVLNR
jgi:DNA polymerase III epsilon subunit-like protein